MNLVVECNRLSASLYMAEQKLRKKYTKENSLLVDSLRSRRDSIAAEIRASGPSVAQIQGDDGVLL